MYDPALAAKRKQNWQDEITITYCESLQSKGSHNLIMYLQKYLSSI